MSDIRHCECCSGDGTDREWFIGAEGEDICARCAAELLGAERDAVRQQFQGAVKALERTWTILHRRDWGHKHDSLLSEGAPIPEPNDDTLVVIEVVPATQLAGAVKALGEALGYLWHDEQDAAMVILETALQAAGVDPSTYRGKQDQSSKRESEIGGFLFVCRTARSQHRHGGNVVVGWDSEKADPGTTDDGTACESGR